MKMLSNPGSKGCVEPRAVARGGWRRIQWRRLAVVWLAASGVGLRAETNQLTLPGTQPMDHSFGFNDVKNCASCHSDTPNGTNDPYFSWDGGMMAQAARDPVFRAALAIANQDLPGSGEFCIRCHAPRAWLEGASAITDGSALTNNFDRDVDYLSGVSCEVCHRLVDPLGAEAKKVAKLIPPGYGNGMMVVDPVRTLRGPYAQTIAVPTHALTQSLYHASSELCGTCHNVSNPTLATNAYRQPPYAYGHIERTYSEWALSDFAKKDSLQTCQSCHFPPVPGGGRPVRHDSKNGSLHREHFVSHSAVGGSTWAQDAVYKYWNGKDLDREALNVGKENARELLKAAVALGLKFSPGKAHLTITNLTGHKFPTGYPEGRRAWVNIGFYQAGKLIAELGRYGEQEYSWNSKVVSVPTLLDPEWTRVYECKPGLSAAQSQKYGKPAGPSFHFILNDVITKDNRIPPRGYRREAFAEHLAAPLTGDPVKPTGTPPYPEAADGVIAAQYADGQFWDELTFNLPPGTERVEVAVMYQSVSWEYLRFLLEENRTNDVGKRLFEIWLETGKCPPEKIAFLTRPVAL